MSHKITYRRLHDLRGAILVENVKTELVTTFSDHLAYMAFVRGLAALNAEGCDITLTDVQGYLIVGDFADPANKVPVVEATPDRQAEIAAKRIAKRKRDLIATMKGF